MKKLVLNLLIFTIPAAIWVVFTNCVLPVTTFTYRTWEATRVYKFRLPTGFGPYYPNFKVHMIEPGDLAHHTKNAIFRSVIWENDDLGYRNKATTRKTPIDILLIGDSFIAGSSLDQDQTLSEQLKLLSGRNVYQIAPSAIEEFDKLLRLKYINKPKMIVFSIVERNLNYLNKLANYTVSKRERRRLKLTEYSFIRNTAILYDRAKKNASYKYISARLKGLTGTGFQSTVNPKFFFFQGKFQLAENKYKYKKIVECIKSYKKYCDSMGIEFVFLPCPNKETVYYEYVPFRKQPATLLKLDSMLCENGINTINTLDLYNKNKPNGVLYNYDDTHWNATAVSLVAHEIVKKYGSKM